MEGARRLISQTLHPATLKKLRAAWFSTDSFQKSSEFTPLPIETREELSFAARGIQWSRWYSFQNPQEKTLNQEATAQPSQAQISGPITKMANYQKLTLDLEDCLRFRLSKKKIAEQGSIWVDSLKFRASAVFGHIIYSWDESKKLRREFGANETVNRKKFSTFLNSQREFLTTFYVPQLFPEPDGKEIKKLTEELHIKLKPSPEVDEHDRARVFPTLVLCVHLNAATKKISLDRVELIVAENEFDLLQPENATDIRFRAESYISSDEQFDPNITQFIASSKLDFFGQEKLETPTNLTISIPAHAISISPTLYGGKGHSNEAEGDVLVKYTFASMEHRSSMWGIVHGPNVYRYTIIEGGRNGGRRQEVQCVWYAEEPFSAIGFLKFQDCMLKANKSITALGFPTFDRPYSFPDMRKFLMEHWRGEVPLPSFVDGRMIS